MKEGFVILLDLDTGVADNLNMDYRDYITIEPNKRSGKRVSEG